MEDWPKYREAYPGIDLVQARKNMDRGLPVCRFRWTNDSEPVGEAFIPFWADKWLLLSWVVRLPDLMKGFGHDRIETDRAQKANASGKAREYFLCPVCDIRTETLYYKFKWACAECHGLSFRSQLITPDVGQTERIEELRAALRHGGRKGRRQSTIRKWQSELKELLKARGPLAAVASEAHFTVVTSEWVSVEVAEELMNPHYKIENGEILPRHPYRGGRG